MTKITNLSHIKPHVYSERQAALEIMAALPSKQAKLHCRGLVLVSEDEDDKQYWTNVLVLIQRVDDIINGEEA